MMERLLPALRHSPYARRIAWSAAIVFGLLLAWTAGLVTYANAIPRTVADTTTSTDAIVVLTGGSGRLREGLRLLAEGRAGKLFVSGVYRGVEVEELLGISRKAPESIACCVILGHAAESTEGNARETARWMEKQGFGSLRLVTASYHMQRSLFEFRIAMPEATIIPNPVFPERVKRDQWWRYWGTTQLIAEEFNKYLVARLRAAVAGDRRS